METQQKLATKKGAILAQPGEYESGEKVGRSFGIFKIMPDELAVMAEEYIGEWGEPLNNLNKVPTLSEFAFKSGVSRRTLTDYSKRGEFRPIIDRIKAFCEMHTDQQLYNVDLRAAGPIFSLKANYGWKDGSVLDINLNIGWNSVLEAAKQRRLKQENPDYEPEPPIDI